MKKITIEPTDRAGRSPLGSGRVWEGTTDQGTPIKVLICGLLPSSDDPALVAQFDREHDALPALPEVCPDCGEPHIEHKLVGELVIDMYMVIARWMIAFAAAGGTDMAAPAGLTETQMADNLRAELATRDRAYHDALVAAAHAASRYVIDKIMAAQGIEQLDGMIGEVAGHA
jgi:hypothetical protein